MAVNKEEVDYHPMDAVIASLKEIDLASIEPDSDDIELVGDLRLRWNICNDLVLDSQHRILLVIDGDPIPLLEQVKADYQTIADNEAMMTLLRLQQETVVNLLKEVGFNEHDAVGDDLSLEIVIYINPDGSLSLGYWGTVNPSPRFSFKIMSDYDGDGSFTLHASFGELVSQYSIEYDAYEDMTDERFEQLVNKLIAGGDEGLD